MGRITAGCGVPFGLLVFVQFGCFIKSPVSWIGWREKKPGVKPRLFSCVSAIRACVQWKRPCGFRFRIRKRRGVLKAAAFSASIDEIVDDGPAPLLLGKQTNAAGL
jgi:hypothetical protein